MSQTRTGKPLNRSNIWSDIKKLCKLAKISEKKVFPHNLRHLFARTYYSLQKYIVRLADILRYSNVNTTRIYTMESGIVHCRQIQKLGQIILIMWGVRTYSWTVLEGAADVPNPNSIDRGITEYNRPDGQCSFTPNRMFLCNKISRL